MTAAELNKQSINDREPQIAGLVEQMQSNLAYAKRSIHPFFQKRALRRASECATDMIAVINEIIAGISEESTQ